MVWNRVLRRIFGSKRDELTGEWRKLHNEFKARRKNSDESAKGNPRRKISVGNPRRR